MTYLRDERMFIHVMLSVALIQHHGQPDPCSLVAVRGAECESLSQEYLNCEHVQIRWQQAIIITCRRQWDLVLS